MTEHRAAHLLIANLMFTERAGRALAELGVEPRYSSGLEAVAAQPAPVVLDLDHSGLDALALLRALRADARTAQLPVLAYGSHVRPEALAEARELGALAVPRSVFSGQMRECLVRLGFPQGA